MRWAAQVQTASCGTGNVTCTLTHGDINSSHSFLVSLRAEKHQFLLSTHCDVIMPAGYEKKSFWMLKKRTNYGHSLGSEDSRSRFRLLPVPTPSPQMPCVFQDQEIHRPCFVMEVFVKSKLLLLHLFS